MKSATPLPKNLSSQYHDWRANGFLKSANHYADLAINGQKPQAMVISCCDSRVDPSEAFEVPTGTFFVHRNIANLVPHFDHGQQHSATSSALEYGVTALNVSSLIVMGHSMCGGVQGCHDKCSGKAPQLEEDGSFVGKWIEILRPAYNKVSENGGNDQDQVKSLEKEGVLNSLSNLMSYPFINERVESGALTVHGLFMDIHTGELQQYDPESDTFIDL